MNVSIILPALSDDDECVEAMKQQLSRWDSCEIIVDDSVGLANAIKCGIDRATRDTIVVMDADGTHPPAVLPYMIMLAEYYDLVCGVRNSWELNAKGILSWWGNQLFKRLLRIHVRDCTSGFFVCSKSRLNELPTSVWEGYGDYYIELLRHASKRKWLTIEVPVTYQPRIGGSGHTLLAKHSAQYIWRVIRCMR